MWKLHKFINLKLGHRYLTYCSITYESIEKLVKVFGTVPRACY